ncbi:MAG TPA: ATP-binding cassette domain-containing protein [Synergistaceae bacterium]|nr:ATP-binding cassette domain-containing protein [Synergistaceae bacterium]HPJ25167.1 ATP-binding cassette domain-containing protein [Synergistaceae bacterium]HPQ36761.1 ATP-binding cassette domain-containing protein [Synergistaceae bacterium]
MSIEFDKVSFSYHKGTPLEKKALLDISLSLDPGEWKAVVGHTGSGKSTLAQLCNALLLPDTGEIRKDGHRYGSMDKKQLRRIRKEVGLVFQYPEQQFFAETVEEELSFAPKNWGVPLQEIPQKVRAVLEKVGFPQELCSRSPFALSGGQKRRVAIASVLAGDPEYLVLDEPTTGLDARGKKELLLLLDSLRLQGIGILHITHDLEVALSWCDRVLVLHQGESLVRGSAREILEYLSVQPVRGLVLPPVAELSCLLRRKGVPLPLTSDFREILRFYGVNP